MNKQEIKVYKDAYADASYAKIGFKGKIVNEKGIIYCPYKKQSKSQHHPIRLTRIAQQNHNFFQYQNL